MKKNRVFLFLSFFVLALTMNANAQTENLGFLLSPNIPTEAIPKELKLPDAVLPFLKTEFNNSIGKQASFDVQFKIVKITTMITNAQSQKYSFLNDIVLWEVRSASKSAQKTINVSPDARVLAIQSISISSNSNFVSTMLAVLERDDNYKTRAAAAKILPALGNNELIVPKLLDLLRNQYGGNRAKFDESDQKRFDDDRVAQAVVETLGELGDARAFPVLLQLVMSPETHRDDTIKAGWDAMKKLKW